MSKIKELNKKVEAKKAHVEPTMVLKISDALRIVEIIDLAIRAPDSKVESLIADRIGLVGMINKAIKPKG